MTRNTPRGVQGTPPTGPRSHRWSGASSAGITILLAVFLLAGCDKPPTFSELLGGKKKEPPPPAPVVQKPAAETPRPFVPPKLPEKPKKTPQELIAEFNAMPAQQHTNEQLIELSRTPDATDQFTALDLSGSGVNDQGMVTLPKFERVETLALNGCRITNGALASVAKMKSLATLSLNGGLPMEQTCDGALGTIKQMQQLTSLSLEGANFTMAGLSKISAMTWLESLDVGRNRFNDDNLELLAPLVHLKDLNISYTSVSDSGFRFLLPFRELETLKIASLPIRGEGLKELSRRGGLPKLKTLVIFNNNLDTAAYEGILHYRRTLEFLDVGRAGLDDSRFVNAIAPLSKLETLMVHDNPGLHDAAMVALPRLKRLKKLYFYKNYEISNNSLPKIAQVRSLENLTLNETLCTEQGAIALKKRLKNCHIVLNGKAIE